MAQMRRIIALNVIVDGEREVRHSHALMSVDDWMDARKAGQDLALRQGIP